MPTFTESRRVIDDLLESLVDDFSGDYFAMVAAIRRTLTLQRLTELVNQARTSEAIDAIEEAAMAALPEGYSRNFAAAVENARTFINTNLNVVIDFAAVNQRALIANNQHRAALVREIVEEQRDVIARVVRTGLIEGINPRSQARTIRETIGLTNNQSQYIANYRAELSNPNGPNLNAIRRRMLHDNRFNSTIRAAQNAGRPLTEAQINRMVENYYNRWVSYRATVIGRTESLRALNTGRDATYQQLIAQEGLRPEDITNIWLTAQDERTRPSHMAMNRQERIEGQPFESGLGNQLRYPGDPDAPAEDTIQCRCSTIREINFVEQQLPIAA